MSKTEAGLARRIAVFSQMFNDRFSPLRDDPVWKPLMNKAVTVYQQEKHNGTDFTEAALRAHTAVIEEMLDD